tara:strand:+ start:952 stop:1212 length:261 start_codon:yes stop_codon:yes gene_type:complete
MCLLLLPKLFSSPTDSSTDYRTEAKNFLRTNGKSDEEIKSVLGETIAENKLSKKTQLEEWEDMKVEVKSLRSELDEIKTTIKQHHP